MKLRLRRIPVETVEMGQYTVAVGYRIDPKQPLAVQLGPAVLEYTEDNDANGKDNWLPVEIV